MTRDRSLAGCFPSPCVPEAEEAATAGVFLGTRHVRCALTQACSKLADLSSKNKLGRLGQVSEPVSEGSAARSELSA